MKILMCLVMSLSMTLAGGEEPEKLKELRGIFETEKAKALEPLVSKYTKALKRYEIEATKAGDLDTALAFRAEREAHMVVLAKPEAERKAPAPVAKNEKKPRAILSESNQTYSGGKWTGAKAIDSSRKNHELNIHAALEGKCQGDVFLILPDESEVLIYSWTGKEKPFLSSKSKPSLALDVSDHVNPPGGDYGLRYQWKSGDGSLFLFYTTIKSW